MLCARLKADPRTSAIPVVMLTGSGAGTRERADEVGADAYMRKPFSPLELLAVVERVAGGLHGIPFRSEKVTEPEEQLLLYARDLRHLLEIERGQRLLDPAGLPGDGQRARERARDEGHRHRCALPAGAALRDGARLRRRARGGRGPLRAVRLPAPRRGEDRRPRRDPPEARAADRPGDARHAHAHAARRADARRRRVPPGRGSRGRPKPSRALGRQTATPTGSSASRSRSARGSSPSPTRWTR